MIIADTIILIAQVQEAVTVMNVVTDIAAAGVFVCAAACVAVGACIFIGNGVLAAAIKFLWYRLWLGMAVVVTVPIAVWFVFHFGRIQ